MLIKKVIMIENSQENASNSIENETKISENPKNGEEQFSELDSSIVQGEANAYTQGTDIIVGPGKEDHRDHEPWHVVQLPNGL